MSVTVTVAQLHNSTALVIKARYNAVPPTASWAWTPYGPAGQVVSRLCPAYTPQTFLSRMLAGPIVILGSDM